ncbi:UNVERIFIED_CONTAM: hypothetical protein GTU68_050063 [Idotea baltica]|nr:hypothetical protein [Idotea baltica]
MSLLSVKNLAIDLRRENRAHRLVHDATFHVDAGETVAIVGESGSGKSLSALAIMGLLAEELSVAEGAIAFEDRDLLGLDAEQMRLLRGSGIAMIFQEPMTSLNPVKSIGRQLTEGMRLNQGISRRDAQNRAIELLQEVGVSDAAKRLKQYPHQLSGGMRQRVMIAIALACKPHLILADEPTTALDVTIQAQILSLTAKLPESLGLTYLFIGHDLSVVRHLCDRVAVMYLGSMMETAASEPLFAQPLHPYTRALIDAVPNPDPDAESERHVEPLQGEVPSPTNPPSGCVFHPRCSHATAQCSRQRPPAETHLPDHIAACWHPVFEPSPIPDQSRQEVFA